MATETVQMKVSGLMCSFCTMSLETALKRYEGVESVLVNLVHGIVLVEADPKQITRDELAIAVQRLGYDVSATEKQQYATDEALFALTKQHGAIGMVLAILDLLLDPLNVLRLAAPIRGWISFGIAAFVLLWVGYPILRKTILAIRQRVINANVLLSAGAWGSFIVGTASLFDARDSRSTARLCRSHTASAAGCRFCSWACLQVASRAGWRDSNADNESRKW